MKSLGAIFGASAESHDVTYVLSHDLALVRANAAWARFARENDGDAVLARWGRGARVDAAISPPLRGFYTAAYARVIATGNRWEHDYECSSPTTFRKFRMVVYPVNAQFLVVVNSLTVEVPHSQPVSEADDPTYALEGIVTMCSHCRRVRNQRVGKQWDWVPSYVASPPNNLSHGLCEACFEYYGLEDGNLLDP